MTNFTLKFGKYKGQEFLSTPINYQNWLLSQDWFKAPVTNKLELIRKEMSQLNKSLKGWDGYSKRGEYAYDRMFELEQQEADIIFCACGRFNEVGKNNCGWDCGY